MTELEQILELARWAPSGDNTQPWRFEILSPEHVLVHAFDTRRDCVYDLDGRASQLSVGALLETMRVAASLHGRSLQVERRREAPEEAPLIDVRLDPARRAPVDPLYRWIRERSVQRKPLKTTPLADADRAALAASVGPRMRVVWFEGHRQRARMAWLAVRSARIRLTIPEAYDVHRRIIDWGRRHSDDRVPDGALGADPMTLRFMRWAMGSWTRVDRLNRYAAGTVAPRLQLDLLPGLRCAAHFAIVADRPADDIDAQLAAGAAVQRFWLTATSLGLQLQPQHTPLVFASYARTGRRFTESDAGRRRAAHVAAMLDRLLGSAAMSTVFLGRVGRGDAATSRSLRRPLQELIWRPPAAAGDGPTPGSDDPQ